MARRLELITTDTLLPDGMVCRIHFDRPQRDAPERLEENMMFVNR